MLGSVAPDFVTAPARAAEGRARPEGSRARDPRHKAGPRGAARRRPAARNARPAAAQTHVHLELGDRLGSRSAVLDVATGELVERATTLAYGATESDYRPGRWNNFREDYRFTGKEEDVEVGLQCFGRRFLSPQLGRWASVDPLAVHGLHADADVYAYVSGRLMYAVDAFGLEEAPPAQPQPDTSARFLAATKWMESAGAAAKEALSGAASGAVTSLTPGGAAFEQRSGKEVAQAITGTDPARTAIYLAGKATAEMGVAVVTGIQAAATGGAAITTLPADVVPGGVAATTGLAAGAAALGAVAVNAIGAAAKDVAGAYSMMTSGGASSAGGGGSAEQPGGKASYPSVDKTAKELGVSRDVFHAEIKPQIVKDFAAEAKRIGAKTPDIGVNKAGNITLRNPKTGIEIHTDVPLSSYGSD